MVQPRVLQRFLTPWGPQIDEATQRRDLLVAERSPFGWHAGFIPSGDTLDEQTIVAAPYGDRVARITACHQSFAVIEPQVSFLNCFPMTCDATISKDLARGLANFYRRRNGLRFLCESIRREKDSKHHDCDRKLWNSCREVGWRHARGIGFEGFRIAINTTW